MARSMNKTASTIGMMDGAFFVSRTELLEWVNGLLQLNLHKVEQCASGAVYCQIIDSCRPGTVSMRKVNWMARSDHEFIPNYKVLQAAFEKNGIQRFIDVDKLIRAKYQDNLEFLQWIKCYWEREGGGCEVYDPCVARQASALPAWAKAPGRPGSDQLASRHCPLGGKGKENMADNARGHLSDTDAIKKAQPLGQRKQRPTTNSSGTGVRPSSTSSTAVAPTKKVLAANAPGQADPRIFDFSADQREKQALREENAAQKEELETMRSNLQGLEDERDYYFAKLREIEILSTTLEASPDPSLTVAKVLQDVSSILYRGDDGDDVVAAED